MTNAQKTKYLEQKGVKCLFCDSDQLYAGHLEQTDDGIYQNVLCLNPDCKKEWTDRYTLTSVEEMIP